MIFEPEFHRINVYGFKDQNDSFQNRTPGMELGSILFRITDKYGSYIKWICIGTIKWIILDSDQEEAV